MSNVTESFQGRNTVAVLEPTTPKIYNVSVVLANTEVSQALSANIRSFLIRVRGGSSDMKLAFVATESATNYVTISAGANYETAKINFSGTLYFQTTKSNQVVEILEWA